MANRRRKSSPITSMVVVALSALIFVVAVGIGVSLLKVGEEPVAVDKSSSEPIVVNASSSKEEKKAETKKEEKKKEEKKEEKKKEEKKEEEKKDNAPVITSVASSAAPASSAPASSAAPAASSAAPAAPAASTVPAAFDPASLGSSGRGNIASYKQINADVKAWLRVPGTNIDYPVLQSAPGYDPHYYLDKNIYRQSSRNGVIYAGSTCKFPTLSKNTVLFGHNWTNYSASPRIGNASDVMFAQLASYHYLNFAKAYPYIWFSTENQDMKWVIFAAFYTDITFNYIEPNPTDSGLSAIISGAKARSRHNFDVDVNSDDKIITMSTCTRAYGSSDRQRFVVMARLLRDGESVKAINVTTNPNPVLPKL